MGVLNLSDSTPPVDDHAFKTQAELKTSTLFDKELSVDKIRFQVDGIRWTIDYFNQILGINSQPMAPDVNIPNTTLNYNRIDKLDIYVDSGLPNGSVTDVVGNGTINAGFVPYIGDAFTATLAGGRIGLFVLTNVTKEYYNTHDIYLVDFKLTYFLDTSAVIYNDLVYKTTRTYVYDKDAVNTFSTPVILAKDYQKKMNLSMQPHNIMDHYMQLFYDRDSNQIRLPTTASTYVDQLVVQALFKLVVASNVPDLARVSRPKVKINVDTVWDAILTRDIEMFSTCVTDLKFAMTDISRSSRRLETYLGIRYEITDNVSALEVIPTITVNPVSARKVVEQPITKPVTQYIFSDAFYAQDPTITFTKFETVLLEYLRGEAPNRTNIEALLLEYKYWDYYDQYTLLPILLLLTRVLVNNTYSSL